MPPVNTPTVTSPTTQQSSPTRPLTPTTAAARPLTPLSYLSSPAPDLASTLYTSQAAEDADEANADFLRDSLDSLDNLGDSRAHVDAERDPRRAEFRRRFWSAQAGDGTRFAASAAQQAHQRETPEDLSRRQRLQRVLARLNRLHEPASSASAAGTASSSAAAYSNRTPSPNRQSLYDWAPSGGYEHELDAEVGELEAILNELRRQQPDTHPDILRVLGQSQLDVQRERERARESEREGERERLGETAGGIAHVADAEQRRSVLRERERRRRETEWVSLRSRAVFQRARQEGAGSPSSTERMLRYVMDRERSGMSEEEERARGTGWFRPGTSRGEGANEEHRSSASSRERWQLAAATNDLRERDRQERVDQFRRGYLAENVPPRLPRISTPPLPPIDALAARSQPSMLENALKYLSDLRHSVRYEDSLMTAIEHGLATKEFFADKHDDFPMDLDELPHMKPSSFLQPGAVFEGFQHATTAITALTHQGPQSSSRVEQINPNYRSYNGPTLGFDHPPGSARVTPFDATRPWRSHHPPAHLVNPKEPHDQWPVRVVIHSIDEDTMTLQGTMEAYDVPQHPSSLSILNSADRPKAGKKNAPITTYLEGHIIDLRTHSFRTPSDHPDTTKKRKAGPHETSVENRTPYTTISRDIAFPSAAPHHDAQNWLKLPPFCDVLTSSSSSNTSSSSSSSSSSPSQPPEDALARLLLSKAHLADLQRDYIFMRWKERCFVHGKHDTCSAPPGDRTSDQDRGHGLTISGFYYLCLRRSDGVAEGLYFDPCSTPYQCLRLQAQGGVTGGWEFR